MIYVLETGGTLVLREEHAPDADAGTGWLYAVDQLDADGRVIAERPMEYPERQGGRRVLEDVARVVQLRGRADVLDRLFYMMLIDVPAGRLEELVTNAIESELEIPSGHVGALALDLAGRIREDVLA